MSLFGLSKLINDAGQTAGTDATPLTVKLASLLASQHSVSIGPNAGNGASRSFQRNLSNSPVAIKASAGVLYGLSISNSAASVAYIQLFDTTGTPTLGQSMANEIFVPASSGLISAQFGLFGVQYTSGIVIAASSAEGGTLAPASGLLVTAYYI